MRGVDGGGCDGARGVFGIDWCDDESVGVWFGEDCEEIIRNFSVWCWVVDGGDGIYWEELFYEARYEEFR